MIVGCNPPVTCAWGCIAVEDPHCGRLHPSNAIAWSLVPANAATLTVPADMQATLDTDTGTIAGFTFPAGTASVVSGAYRVIAADAIVIEPGATVFVVGSRLLVLLALDRVTVGVGAVIDLDGGCRGTDDMTCAGPGGGRGADATIATTGCGPGGHGDENEFGPNEAGGGGGGMATIGGHGGGVAIVGQGIPGIMCGSAINVPLQGGSGGGVGGVSSTAGTIVGGRGGGGGGAIQISAGNTITLAGTISANGAGGESGHALDLTGGGGGGGGGAGGGVLLEAGRVDVSGGVFANGGGGGGNALASGGGNGTTGRRDTACAAGGLPGSDSPGAAGGCLATAPTNTGAAGDRGGGGGAAGWLTIDRTIGATTGVTSPAPTLGTPDFD